MIDLLLALVGAADNIAILVLLVVCIGSGWLHVIWRREEREDRQRAYALVQANTEALTALRVAISASLGRET